MTDKRKEALPDEKIVGENIKKIRKSKGMTQEQLAEKISDTCSGKTISRYENGNGQMLLSTYFGICEALEVSPNDLSPERLLQMDFTTKLLEDYRKLNTEYQETARGIIRLLLYQQRVQNDMYWKK